jgi:hypothetical protein
MGIADSESAIVYIRAGQSWGMAAREVAAFAGTLILPWRVHCAGVMSSAVVSVEIIPGIAKAIP